MLTCLDINILIKYKTNIFFSSIIEAAQKHGQVLLVKFLSAPGFLKRSLSTRGAPCETTAAWPRPRGETEKGGEIFGSSKKLKKGDSF